MQFIVCRLSIKLCKVCVCKVAVLQFSRQSFWRRQFIRKHLVFDTILIIQFSTFRCLRSNVCSFIYNCTCSHPFLSRHAPVLTLSSFPFFFRSDYYVKCRRVEAKNTCLAFDVHYFTPFGLKKRLHVFTAWKWKQERAAERHRKWVDFLSTDAPRFAFIREEVMRSKRVTRPIYVRCIVSYPIEIAILSVFSPNYKLNSYWREYSTTKNLPKLLRHPEKDLQISKFLFKFLGLNLLVDFRRQEIESKVSIGVRFIFIELMSAWFQIICTKILFLIKS